MEFKAIAEWTLFEEAPIPDDVYPLLTAGEHAHVAFKTFRDSAIFTNKRLIVRDSQGLRGKKVEMYSLPYSAINMWSTENAGSLDFNAGHIKIKIGRKLDVRAIDKLIGDCVLG